MTKYVVCGTTEFYPWVREFDSLDEAQKYYDENEPWNEDVYLCEVIDTKSKYRFPDPSKSIFDLIPKSPYKPRGSAPSAKTEK